MEKLQVRDPRDVRALPYTLIVAIYLAIAGCGVRGSPRAPSQPEASGNTATSKTETSSTCQIDADAGDQSCGGGDH